MHSSFRDRLFYLCYIIGYQLDPALLAELDPLGLTGRTLHLLRLVADSDGTSSQRELADKMRMDPTLMVIAVDSLEDAGLLRRQRSTVDRRRYDLTITPAGTKRLAEAEARLDHLEVEFFGHLSAEEQDQLRALLQSLFKADVAPISTPH